MPRVVHFEIQAEDPKRAIHFYSRIFGWEAQKWDGPEEYYLLRTGSAEEPGIDGGLIRRRGPDESATNTIRVDSVDDTVAHVLREGGRVVVPKRAIPGVGWVARCADTEGNLFGVMAPDPAAR